MDFFQTKAEKHPKVFFFDLWLGPKSSMGLVDFLVHWGLNFPPPICPCMLETFASHQFSALHTFVPMNKAEIILLKLIILVKFK